MGTLTLTINKHKTETRKGLTVLQAALEAGIYIPHLCYHPDLPSIGACRLCVVEIEGIPGLPTACTTPAEEGMVVTTKTPHVDRVRQISMELMLAGHPSECTTCPKYLNCELQSLKQYLGITEELRVKRYQKPFDVNTGNPLFLHDFNRCVLCGRCVRACNDLRGIGVLSFIKRGIDTFIGTAFDRSLAEASCRFCGACVEVCPTGSIRDAEGIINAEKNRQESLIPCKHTCPAGIDVPRYVRLIKDGSYADAVAVIREKVPFPGVLGYVCNSFCEPVCRRIKVNEGISIRDLKLFAAERDDRHWKRKSTKSPLTDKKVAIVGSGPAGLTTAYYLAKQGHSVTVFETLPYPGGMMRFGIPQYRLSREVLESEIKEIESAGIEIRTNTRVDSLDMLLSNSYNAIIVATGTHQGLKLPISGADSGSVLIGIDFLKDVNLGKEVSVGERVLVLGGGNVAFDCARVARRLGAQEVHLACLESRDNMLASADEIKQGEEEGIIIHCSHSFTKVTCSGALATGMECMDVQSFAFDNEGKLQVKVAEDSEHFLPADTIIFAIGQRPEVPAQFGLATGHGNTVQIDPDSFTTSRQGIFAVGDCVRGTSSVIEAIASGRKGAVAVDKYLGGTGIIDERLAPDEEPKAWLGRTDKFTCLQRQEATLIPAEKRLEGFNKIVAGFDEKAAVEESSRCLQCDLRLRISTVKFWADYSS